MNASVANSLVTLNRSVATNGSQYEKISGCRWPLGSTRMYDINVENTPTLWVEIIFYPVLLCCCTFGNIISITVLLRDVTKTSTNVYLICLAVSDLFVVWFAMLFYIPEVNNTILKDQTFLQNTFNYRGFQLWWQDTCLQFSDWTLILFSCERLFAIARPLEYKYRLTVKRAMSIEFLVFLLAALCELEGIVVYYYWLSHDDGVHRKSQIVPQSLLKWEVIQNSAEVGITITKWCLLTIINVVLIIIIAKHNMIRNSVLHISQAKTAEDKDQVNHASTYILLSCVAVYFVTQFPTVIYKILDISSRPPFCSYNLTYRAKNNARPFVYMALLTNYSINFFLYCLVWKKFRLQVGDLFCRVCRKRRASLTGLSGTDSGPATATTTPGGLSDGQRMAKMSLENQDDAKLNVDMFLAAAKEHQIKKLGLDPDAV